MKLFALITCDSVSIDEKTGKHSILGHFSSIRVKHFPATHPELTFFVGITQLEQGEHTAEVVLSPPPNTPTSASGSIPQAPVEVLLEQTLLSEGPWEHVYLISQLKSLTFAYEGLWQLEVWIDGEFVGSIGLDLCQ